MSGPKVVRIVTREEVIAICRGHLARLDAALDQWRRVGRRNETLSEAEIASAESRRDALRRLLAQERFLDLQKAVPEEIAYLAVDQEARLAKAAAIAAQARTAQRRTQAVASTVLAALDQAGVSVPADLRRHLKETIAGRVDGGAAITRAFAILSSTNSPAVTAHQRRIADSLKGDDDRQSFSQWLGSQPAGEQDHTLVRLEQQLAQLTVTLGDTAVSAFEDRLRQVWSAPPSRRTLLLDSLEIELAQAVARTRERTSLQDRLRMLAAELDQAATEASRGAAESVHARLDGPSEDLVKLEAEATAVLTRVRDQLAAKARRKAVLQGLAGLGYQVSEGMETAWVKDGRVVLRKPLQAGYGLEVGGGVGSPRMQMRTVAFRSAGTPADTARDQDAETIWCGELATLEAQLAAVGGGLVIERRLPVGATPVKVITDTDAQRSQTDSEQARARGQRSIP